MKKDEFKKAFEQLKPNEKEVNNMLKKILHKGETTEKTTSERAFPRGKIVLAFVLVFVIAVTIFTMDYLTGNKEPKNQENQDIAQLDQQFQYKNRHYAILADEKKGEFGFSDTVQGEDIGEKIGTISDEPLNGKEFFEYLPANGEAVVAVQDGDGYRLYEFYSFERYLNNHDEDVVTYLKLYGFNNADDIEKIQFITSSQVAGKTDKSVIAEITLGEDIRTFYNYYSVMKDSSEEYFDQLFGKSQTVGQKDVTVGIPGSFVNPSGGQGTTLLDNAVLIRIVAKTGVYMDAPYYPNMGFISRHKVSVEFADFLNRFGL
ncbi:MAG TPA: hypothetical protein DDZ89_02675 [Clostridiales bacterium]|nr:hypothetical protein [Clostridiales bacterium]